MISYLSMSSGMKCANCGKGVAYGHDVSHAKNRTKRLFKPNLHFARVMIDGLSDRANHRHLQAGAIGRVRLCTKCLRMLKKQSKPVVPTVSPIAA